MAASVVYNILSEPYVFEEWPHFHNISGNNEKGTVLKEKNKRLSELASEITKNINRPLPQKKHFSQFFLFS